MRKLQHRALSVVLAFCMLFSCVVIVPFRVNAATSRAQSDGYVPLDGVHLNYDNTLEDLGDGTFLLTVRAYSTFEMEETNRHSMFSENGYYAAEKGGTYLIEMWGGDGGTVSPAGSPLGEGGVGGAGGYVYGLIELNPGDVLYYTLGGNGRTTNETGGGGGVNGDGGTHGGTGNTTVGGGGGYSALFLYDNAEFSSKYLDGDGEMTVESITESDRLSKYIMIAGGGGGGGSHSMDKQGYPDGGAGGSIGDLSGALTGASYAVQGTFFAGHDGLSSGNSTAFVGRGGSNEPGETEGTWLNFTAGEHANDWNGLPNTAMAGGAGGAGNLRGGSGGAGYCGGSGGLQTSFISPTNVGGGGGGSSFVSTLFDYELTESEAAAMVGENPSSTGGAICITYMEREEIDYLNDLTLRFNTSEYLKVLEAYGYYEGENYDLVASVDPKRQDEYVFSGVEAHVGRVVVLELLFAPLIDFAGGNRVPLFAETAGYSHGVIRVETPNGEHGGGMIRLGEACSYVNIPLNFTVLAQNHYTNQPGAHHAVKDLYHDNYADVRGNLSLGGYRYAFIQSIGEYTVTDLSGTVLTDDVAPTETTKYIVGFTVVPKNNGVAAVGEPVATKKFTAIAIVTIEGSHITQINGNWVTYYKSIGYDTTSNEYCLRLDIKSDTNREFEDIPQPPKFQYTADENGVAAQVQTTLIEYSGYYYIEIWGGAGGSGGDGALTSTDGGSGGAGGYVGGYVYLKAGELLHVHIGANGAKGANGTGLSGGKGGRGGEPSAVALLATDANGNALHDANGDHVIERYLMIAGGGSGGSGGFFFNRQNGVKPSTTNTDKTVTAPTSLSEVLASYSGGNGKDSAGGAGAASTNYIDSTRVGVQPSVDNPLVDPDMSGFGEGTYTNNGGGGAFHLNYLQLDLAGGGARALDLSGYAVQLALAKYFHLTSYRVVDNYQNTLVADTTVAMEVDPDFTLIEIDNINPIQKEYTPEGGNETYKTVDFTVHIHVQPYEDFIGGNDVMLVDVSEETRALTGLQTGMDFSQTIIQGTGSEQRQLSEAFDVLENSKTDYVNVPIRWDPIPALHENDQHVFTTRNKVHIVDESSPVRLSQLFTTDAALLAGLQSQYPTGNISADDDWQADYATLMGPVITDETGVSLISNVDIELDPEETTTYMLSYGVFPKNPVYYATVVEEATPLTDGHSVTIYAAHRVHYHLDPHIIPTSKQITDFDPLYSGGVAYVAEVGKDYEILLNVEAGDYSLPETVKITLGSESGPELIEGRDYTYDHLAKKIVIFADAITDELHISAETTARSYQLNYVVQTVEGGLPSSGYAEYTVPMWAGDPIDHVSHYAGALAAANVTTTSIPGYTFRWDWGDGSEVPLAHMPVEDWWVFGTFEANEYELVIHYVNERGELIAPSYQATHTFGDTVNVVSPTVDGYISHTPTFTAQINQTLIQNAQDGVITATVIYTSITNEVVLNLVLENGTLADRCTVTFDFAADEATWVSTNGYTYVVDPIFGAGQVSYTVLLPAITGYHTDTAAVSSVLTENEGQTVQVDYKANRYRLTFDANGGSCVESERTVIYDMPYNYNGSSYTAFPNAILVGSKFLGWVDSNGMVVSETDIVLLDAADGAVIPLKAKWERATYTVTLRYVYEDGTEIGLAGFETATHNLAYGAPYAYVPPALAGYTPSPSQASGTMAAQNVLIVFTYYPNETMEEISVSITWGTLTFDATRGMWDTEALAYDADVFTPQAAGQNVVTVVNHSAETAIHARLDYVSATGYDSITGYFTASPVAGAPNNQEMAIAPNGAGDMRYVWLRGDIPDNATGTVTCGTVNVTVTPQS